MGGIMRRYPGGGEFETLDTTQVTYFNWMPGQPNDRKHGTSKGEDCVEKWNKWSSKCPKYATKDGWNDMPCHHKRSRASSACAIQKTRCHKTKNAPRKNW